MIIAGLWHGASWMFIVWGVMHGIGLVVHKFCNNNGLKQIPNTKPIKVACWLITFGYISLAWIFFRAPNMDSALTLITNIIQTTRLSDAYTFLLEYPLWTAVVLISLELHSIKRPIMNGYKRSSSVHHGW